MPTRHASLRPISLAVACALASAALPAHANPQADASAAVAGLEEITVTARRRTESLQDVPITVTAFTAERFESQQMSGLRDLHLSAPNLTIVNNTGTSNSAQVFIRGIGRDDSTWNVESGVAIYLDGVYLPQQNGALLDLVDFERVEVLNGPQGTLYGRNATGGAIKFVTRKPSLGDFNGVGEVTIGSFDRFDLRGALDIPLIDGRLGARVDFVSRDESGFVTDIANGRALNATDRQTGRLSLRYLSEGGWDFVFAVDRQTDRSGLQSPTPIRRDNGTIVGFDGDGLQLTAYGSDYLVNPGVEDINDYAGTGYSLVVTKDLRFGTLTSTTSKREFDWDVAIDLDGQTSILTDLYQTISDSAFSQELQLASANDTGLNYVAGVYYFDDDISMGANNVFINRRNDSSQQTTSYAVYGELTYDFANRVQVFAGGRYNKDEKDIVQRGAVLGTGASPFNVAVSDSWSSFSPRAGINFRWNDDLMLYATYSEGFKAGGVANGRPGDALNAAATFDPEEVEAIEIGIKSSWFDNRLVANVSAFDTTYSNIAFTFLDPATNSLQVLNADAEIKGLEYSISWRPLPALSTYVLGGIIDDKFTKIPVNPATGVPLGGLTPASRLKHVAPHHFKAGASYTVDVGAGRITADVNYMKFAKIYRNTANSEQGATQPTELVDARIAYEFADGRYAVALAGQNLTDESYWLQSLSTFARWYAKPRTWSLEFKAKL